MVTVIPAAANVQNRERERKRECERLYIWVKLKIDIKSRKTACSFKFWAWLNVIEIKIIFQSVIREEFEWKNITVKSISVCVLQISRQRWTILTTKAWRILHHIPLQNKNVNEKTKLRVQNSKRVLVITPAPLSHESFHCLGQW